MACSFCEKDTDAGDILVVDAHNGLEFCSEECVQQYFAPLIQRLENEHKLYRKIGDIPQTEFAAYEKFLVMVLTEPDEIWVQESEDPDASLAFFIGEFFEQKETIFYVAACYLSEDRPTFVYFHFPTKDPQLLEHYRVGLPFEWEPKDDEPETGTAGDTESDGEDDATLLIEKVFDEMLDYRDADDIDVEEFERYKKYELMTLEKPEEIWQYVDDEGTTFLHHIARHECEGEMVAYVVISLRDEFSEQTIPIFAFPTVSQNMVEHYRRGEKLFPEEEN